MHFSFLLIGAKFSTYFYMTMMITSLLHIIPMATYQSLFAEGSYSETELKVYQKKAIKIISIIIIPAIIVTSLFENYILLSFGKKYSNGGFILLKFLSISGIFISLNAIGGAILNIKLIFILYNNFILPYNFSLSTFYILHFSLYPPKPDYLYTI